MTNPTNLTDEGLTEMAKQLRRSWRDWMNQSPMAPKDVEAGITPPWMYATDEYELDRRIKSALQQVRDAAKKEERGRCAEIAKRFNYWNNLTGKDAQELTAFRIAAYIREQE